MSEKASVILNLDSGLYENTTAVHKRIGNTTYIVTSRFNGDKKRDMTDAFVRLIKRDSSIISG